MAIDSKHPLYIEFLPDWEQMKDTYRGERVVKSKGTLYLPATSGMEQDGMTANEEGAKAYAAYLKRAVFHEFVSDAVEAAIGIMHQKPPTIELPEVLEPMRNNATVNGESLEHLLRRINEQQLVTGRLGLLADLPATPMQVPQPYIAIYEATSILNWDNGAVGELTIRNLNLVVLDESENERDASFTWTYKNKYRVLILGDLTENEAQGKAVYKAALLGTNQELNVETMEMPTIVGTPSTEIPFVFINSKDIVPDPDDPPLLGLSSIALAIYRAEADYRHSLFMQGQDTLVVVGGNVEDKIRVGANAVLHLPQVGATAEYIGVSSDGLKAQREALQDDKRIAASKAGQFINEQSKTAESGEALEIRLSAQTATLNQIAISGAAGLESLLKILAKWRGADPEKVKVTPNLEFAGAKLAAEDLVKYMTAKTMGAPLSLESIHLLMQKRGLTEKEFEEEMRLIGEEDPVPGNDDTGLTDGPTDDNTDDSQV